MDYADPLHLITIIISDTSNADTEMYGVSYSSQAQIVACKNETLVKAHCMMLLLVTTTDFVAVQM